MFNNLFLIVTLCASLSTNVVAQPAYAKNYAMIFETWMQTHRFNFTEHDYLNRLKTFIENDKFIDLENLKNLSYTLGHNKFSHMDFDEFSKTILCGNMKSNNLRGVNNIVKYTDVNVSALPTSIDWRTRNTVTPVKDQGNCGSCWSFSTTGSLESSYSIKTGQLVSFSEQNLVDCDHLDSGCSGGLMSNAAEFIRTNNGLCTEKDYPYVSGTSGKEGKCQTSCKTVQSSDAVSWVDVKQNDVDALKLALTKQAVSVAVEANRGFQMYKSGVYTASCGSNLDHGVLAVGYNSADSQPYWIVKNSWSNSWGEDGYIRLAMNVDQKAGQCGILSMAGYVTV
jgi:C1A family cysteine protease